jgi:hypothetical protein
MLAPRHFPYVKFQVAHTVTKAEDFANVRSLFYEDLQVLFANTFTGED